MKAQFISQLVSTPLNIDRIRARSIIGHIVATLLKNERPDEDAWGGPLPKMRIEGDVAIIPIRGLVMMNVPDWVKSYGFNITDANDIESELDQALANPDVNLIVHDSDSPGGSSLAGDKLFDITEAANRRKPVFGWCGDGAEAASTAYEAIAPCRAILAGWYASAVGCVGSYLAHLDDTKYLADLGFSMRVFRSGEIKGIGIDELSEAQAAYLQSLVDTAGATFRKNVSKYRTAIAREDMEGQWFNGTEAAKRGFVAGNAKDLRAAILKFRGML
jgi:ClpP class serine protease